MKKFGFGIILGIVACFLWASPKAKAEVSFDFFYESLEPYGGWVEVPEYGYCWYPYDVGNDWRPYQDGYWTYTDAGWTWVSYEDYGWITYHYGRWVRLEDWGWIWMPDYEWGPAWVSWRSGDDYIGWAPLPPAARFTRDVGFSAWVDVRYDIGPSYYNFCEVRHFGAPVLRNVIINRSRNVTIINNTINVTNITYNNDVVYNGGPDYRVISRRSERPINRFKLVRHRDSEYARNAVRDRSFRPRTRGNELVVAAPTMTVPAKSIKPRKVDKKFAKADIDRGWRNIKDPKQKEAIRAKMDREVEGKKDTPARRVKPEEIAVIPTPAGDQNENREDRDRNKGRNRDRENGATAQSETPSPQPEKASEATEKNREILKPFRKEEATGTPQDQGVTREQRFKQRMEELKKKNRERPSQEQPNLNAQPTTEPVGEDKRQEQEQKRARQQQENESRQQQMRQRVEDQNSQRVEQESRKREEMNRRQSEVREQQQQRSQSVEQKRQEQEQKRARQQHENESRQQQMRQRVEDQNSQRVEQESRKREEMNRRQSEVREQQQQRSQSVEQQRQEQEQKRAQQQQENEARQQQMRQRSEEQSRKNAERMQQQREQQQQLRENMSRRQEEVRQRQQQARQPVKQPSDEEESDVTPVPEKGKGKGKKKD